MTTRPTCRCIMRNFTAMIASLVVLTVGCCSQTSRTASDANTPVLVTGSTPVAYDMVLAQLTAKSKARKIAGLVTRPVSTVEKGLPDVQRVSPRPIVAIVEQGDWFFYATSAAIDRATHQSGVFVAGYAIKRGGQEIIEWSAW